MDIGKVEENSSDSSKTTHILEDTISNANEDDCEKYLIHKYVFLNAKTALSHLLRNKEKSKNISEKDKHGNTPLHLSVLLGRKECTNILLSHNALVKAKNSEGWSTLCEAISYGDREIIYSLLKKHKHQSRQLVEERRPKLIDALLQMGDFYMELKWDFHSWVPLISKALPSDVCKIYKSGERIRLDTTIVDFTDMKWVRGDISFLYSGDKPISESLCVLDNEFKCFQKLRHEVSSCDLQDEVDILMSSDIVGAQISTKDIKFSRAQSGWFFREDRKEVVAGQYNCDLYSINGLTLMTRKRREHLSKDDLYKNKLLVETFTKGNNSSKSASSSSGSTSTTPNGSVIGTPTETRRESLIPPPETSVSWKEYISAEPGCYPYLGRKVIKKQLTKHLKATVAMSTDFPISIDKLLNVMEVVAPFKQFAKLREFITMKLPAGFPVKFEIPILTTVSAKITFQKFEFRDNIPNEYFEIPSDYVEDSRRFPEL